MGTKAAKQSRTETRVRYIVNTDGEKTEVVLPIELYEELLERLEDAEDIQAVEEVMKAPDFVAWDEAERQIDELPDSD